MEDISKRFEFLRGFQLSEDEVLDCNLHLGDLSALVVASENGKSILEADLQSNEKGNSLDWVVATVDIIAHE